MRAWLFVLLLGALAEASVLVEEGHGGHEVLRRERASKTASLMQMDSVERSKRDLGKAAWGFITSFAELGSTDGSNASGEAAALDSQQATEESTSAKSSSTGQHADESTRPANSPVVRSQ
eukprot:gb/GFBE01047018.1/.p1 GENE.gb/GFBE01047018.1/~~gb/GFBE01047018.1/.p1  ORF type:complete len:120 (+),score=20.12 gb/GFBE01047018.1/:1-360(+)